MEPEKPSRLVSDWRSALKWWSVRLAILAPFALEAIWTVVSAAPPELRAFIRMPLWFALAGLAIAARMWNQKRD